MQSKGRRTKETKKRIFFDELIILNTDNFKKRGTHSRKNRKQWEPVRTGQIWFK